MSVSSNIATESPRDLLREEPCDEIDNDDKEFPTTSIRVLLVDSDPNSLSLMKNLMTQFSYQVTDFENGDDAIAFLMKNKHEIDLVIWDFHVPEINGLEALNTIGQDQMDLPVVITSHEHKKETVMKSTKHGACDFLVKPVSKEVIAVLWRHVYHKRMSKSGLDSVESDTQEDDGLRQDNNDLYHSNEEGSKNAEDSGDQNTCDKKGDKPLSKKPRMTWTAELHHKFLKSVENFGGVEKAVPKYILKCMREDMNVEGLTRNNVASHLQRLRWQKYRLAENKPCVPQETREDSGWHYKPLLNPSINLHTRVPSSYFTNDQAAENAPIQYPSINYLTMNNSHFMNNPYIGSFHQPPQQQQQQQRQQQYYHNSLQIPSVITKQDPAYVSSAMETSGLLYPPNLPYDYNEYFLPEYNNIDPINRY